MSWAHEQLAPFFGSADWPHKHAHHCTACKSCYSCECPHDDAMYRDCPTCIAVATPPTAADVIHAHALGIALE